LVKNIPPSIKVPKLFSVEQYHNHTLTSINPHSNLNAQHLQQ